ncbi:MAG: LysR substrate-binding domain-containing protein [Casimicrobiaceae bacterium]|nr:LysR substrate-binding domain-containing protein [Casimicrobiaceae bacterium]MCX8097939.1 LysR substrate-binding domain-containing protein [Casimicrobiaceae bacterium]MDW8312880.1 LysR substrate-binding domain-containing protein [Burkholderiales bacterium]
MRNATFRQLRVFSEVAKHLSISRAAEALHLTPPAVSMQIKELEGHIGLPLFERDGRRLSLTTGGEYMLVYARRILATLKDAQDAAARLARREAGLLTVGMVSTAAYFVPRLVADFKREHPGIEVRLALGNREQLLGMLSENEVDLAIMGRPPKEMATRAEPFAAHPHVFIAPRGHALERIGHPSPATIAAYDFIVREPGSGTRALFEEFMRRHGLTPRIAMEIASNELLKQSVAAGLGIGFVSLHTIEHELDRGELFIVTVEGTPIVRAWNCVHTLSKLLAPPAEAFRYFVLEHGERMLAERFAGRIAF